MQPGWCLICGSTRRLDFARKKSDRVADRLAGDASAQVRFLLCEDCGHVYQDPMLDERDLACFYDDGYRPFFAEAGEAATEQERGRKFCDELAPLVESLTSGRQVLDIGCGSGSFLLAFKQRGWDVFGIDPVPTWTEYVRRLVGGTEESVVTGWYGPQVFPGQTFSLILFSHTIEHLPDPIPMLRAMRRHLADDGLLFVATPNLINPPGGETLFKGFLAGAHVRLYSPSSLKTVLAKGGFRVKVELHYRPAFGMGALALPADGSAEGAPDDAAAIADLFLALQQPSASTPLGRNLASLLKSQPVVLPPLCRKTAGARLEPSVQHGRTVAIVGLDELGAALPLAWWSETQPGKPELMSAADEEAKAVVQLGLGSGAEARTLAGRLVEGQHLFVWEADPALAKAILTVTDLSDLWDSGHVTLLLGERPLQPTEQTRRLVVPATVYRTESARRWMKPAYRSIARRLGVDLHTDIRRDARPGPVAAR